MKPRVYPKAPEPPQREREPEPDRDREEARVTWSAIAVSALIIALFICAAIFWG